MTIANSSAPSAFLTERLLRAPVVVALTGRSLPTIYVDMRKGAFPKNVKIGPRASAWPESEVLAWIEARKRQRSAA